MFLQNTNRCSVVLEAGRRLGYLGWKRCTFPDFSCENVSPARARRCGSQCVKVVENILVLELLIRTHSSLALLWVDPVSLLPASSRPAPDRLLSVKQTASVELFQPSCFFFFLFFLSSLCSVPLRLPGFPLRRRDVRASCPGPRPDPQPGPDGSFKNPAPGLLHLPVRLHSSDLVTQKREKFCEFLT